MEQKKWWVPMMVLVLVLSIIAGCTGNKNNVTEETKSPAESVPTNEIKQEETPELLNMTGFPIVNEPISLSMMGSKTANQLVWEEMALFQEMAKLTNINFTFDTPAAESYKEKLNLRFASGNLPDVLFGANLLPENEILFGSQGQLIPLEELIEKYAPNIQKVLDDNPDIRRNITTPDGHIYSLPFVDTAGSYPKLWINESWLKDLQLPMPQTIDEFVEVLKAFKEKDLNQNNEADEIPMSFQLVPSSGMPDVQYALQSAFGFAGNITVDEDKVRFAPSEPEYKEYLSFMNELYELGLLDKEGYSQTPQQKNAKGNNNRLGVFHSGGAFQVVGNELDKDYSILPPLTSSSNPVPFSIRTSNLIRGTFAITSANAHPEATIRWIDYMYTAEGAILAAQGIEGEHFEYIDNQQGIKVLMSEGENPAEFRGKISPGAGTFIPRIHEPVQNLNQYKMEEMNPLNYHITAETDKKLVPIARDGFPLIYFTADEQQQLKVLETDISTYVNEMSAKFIVGAVGLDKWEEYTATLDKMKVKQFVEIYQQAYDRWKLSGK